ncbi:glycosyltransferase [Asaia sp. As-1742]|uniref:glycosyltransferase n=1 Tax=Asaia sp. As-1742 TaxID=2608325 RepID=UPI0014208D29|nr:glycosyltransferase [Asaia sp. As-1742]NIE80511.1 glycosyltransferase [Asaia sp. As-1742]
MMPQPNSPNSSDAWVDVAEGRQPSSRRPPPVQSGYGHTVTAKDRADWQRWHDSKAQDAYRRGTDASNAGDIPAALYWLGRAARMAHHDPNVIFAYGMALLSGARWEEASRRFAWIARRFVMRKAYVGQAIALSHLGRTDEAVAIFGKMLSCYAPAEEVLPWTRLFTVQSGAPGWCATSNEGVLHGEAHGPVTIWLDGEVVASNQCLPFTLPAVWEKSSTLSVSCEGKLLYGAPIDLRSIRQMQGFVSVRGHALDGWIWYPADPDFSPPVMVEAGETRIELLATRLEQGTLLEKPLARPRHFSIALDELPQGEIRLYDRYGQPLTGSPLGPTVITLLEGGIDSGGNIGLPRAGEAAFADERVGERRTPGCLVIIPVYRDHLLTRQCIEAVLADKSEDLECLVVDDCSPEPALSHMLDEFAARGDITLIRHAYNRGFTVSANAGLFRAEGRDVILLNNDAIIPEGGINRLRAWLDRDRAIGTVTPFSNDASILSYPSVSRPNPVPDRRLALATDRIFRSLPKSGLVDLPTGNGFCMAIRGDCLAQTGLLDAEIFAQGYGEENDFCCRASALGWRHVAATDLFVRHVGTVSFGRTRSLLLERNLRMLNILHPGYDERVAAFIEKDPFRLLRRNAGLVRMIARRKSASSCLIIVTHDSGGGVERVIDERRRQAEREKKQVLVLRPHERGCRIEDCGGDTVNLVFDLPREWLDFISVLRRMKAERIEWHHLIGHAPVMRDLAAALDLEWDIFLHDYIWFCPRICLVGPNDRYCGEPALAGCEACVAQQGALIESDLTVAELVAQSDRILRGAREVIAGSIDLQRRFKRHFTGLEITLQPLESGDYPALKSPRPLDGTRRRICIPGAIGREKGYEIVLQLAEDAARRNLPIDYIVAGYTIDDDRLIATGHVQVLGEYREEEAVSLIESCECDIGLIPSIWPETWCFALSNLWNARLPAVSFDLGAQSERIQRERRGTVVPLGMPLSLLSNVLLHFSHQMI